MTTTPAMPELPEPELGHIETDKSRQPAFSARQMRAALQAQPAEVSDVIAIVRERYRGTKWGKAAECICDAVDEAILALRPQAESDARRAAQEQLYTERERHTAEVKRLQAEIGRLQSLRPQAVPMTLAEVAEAHAKAPYTSNDSFYSIFSCGIRAAEAHHGITAPAGWEVDRG